MASDAIIQLVDMQERGVLRPDSEDALALAFAEKPIAVLKLKLPEALVLAPSALFPPKNPPSAGLLALAPGPTAVCWVDPFPSAFAFCPQAILFPFDAEAPSPFCGSLPTTLPPQTNAAAGAGERQVTRTQKSAAEVVRGVARPMENRCMNIPYENTR